MLCQSLLLPHLPAVSRNDTNVSSCHTQRDTKSEPKRRGHHDSPPPEQQEFVSLLIASFANPAVKTELLSNTSVCRQLHHRRLLLLEFLLQMTILPHVSDDSSARISETFLILCLAATRRLRCLPCEVPSGRVVHPASVCVTTTRE